APVPAPPGRSAWRRPNRPYRWQTGPGALGRGRLSPAPGPWPPRSAILRVCSHQRPRPAWRRSAASGRRPSPGRVSALQPARRPATPPIRPAIACVSLAYRLPGWWQAAIATPTPGSGARPDGNRPPALAVLHGLPAPPAVLAAGLHRAGIGPAAPADSLDGPAPRCGPAVAATVVAMWPRLGWRQPG